MDRHIAVIGLGYVGIATSVGLAELGHHVTGYDVNPGRVADLVTGRAPIREEGLDAALAASLSSGRLHYVPDLAGAIREAQFIFLCTGTPPGPGGTPDLSQVLGAVEALLQVKIPSGAMLVLKSTVPPGTGRLVARHLASRGVAMPVAVNPEFLREGTALQDFRHPSRVVIGADSPEVQAKLAALFNPLSVPLVRTDPTSAEIIKYGSNAFLAMRISFINTLADLCEATGAQIDTVATGLGLDPRIGPAFLRAGAGYGGSCLPKDVDGLISVLQETKVNSALFDAVRAVNTQRVELLMKKLRHHVPDLRGALVAVLGLSFKPGTDDTRDAPAMRLVPALLDAGAHLRLHDPWGGGNFARQYPPSPPRLQYAGVLTSALNHADAAVILTEWPEYSSLPPAAWRGLMWRPVVIDGRNLFAPDAMAAAGVDYESVGRPLPGLAATPARVRTPEREDAAP